MIEKFSVVQFFEDGTSEYVRRAVTPEEAMKAARHYTSSVGVKMGVVTRVIITDMGDSVCFEWINGRGIVYPPQNGVINDDN